MLPASLLAISISVSCTLARSIASFAVAAIATIFVRFVVLSKLSFVSLRQTGASFKRLRVTQSSIANTVSSFSAIFAIFPVLCKPGFLQFFGKSLEFDHLGLFFLVGR